MFWFGLIVRMIYRLATGTVKNNNNKNNNSFAYFVCCVVFFYIFNIENNFFFQKADKVEDTRETEAEQKKRK